MTSIRTPNMGAIWGGLPSNNRGDIYTTPPATPLESVSPPQGAMGLWANPPIGLVPMELSHGHRSTPHDQGALAHGPWPPTRVDPRVRSS